MDERQSDNTYHDQRDTDDGFFPPEEHRDQHRMEDEEQAERIPDSAGEEKQQREPRKIARQVYRQFTRCRRRQAQAAPCDHVDRQQANDDDQHRYDWKRDA